MILGSHNSWSFRWPKKFWQKLLFFTAKCQNKTIQEQYALGVRCFDLRVRFDKNNKPHIVHNSFDYGLLSSVFEDLKWLDERKDVCIRLLHDVRKKKDYTPNNVTQFRALCDAIQVDFPHLKFWCGRNLYNWGVDYKFKYCPTCLEFYSSVCPPKIVDDWLPIMYAKLHNKSIKQYYLNDELLSDSILLLDFVNI